MCGFFKAGIEKKAAISSSQKSGSQRRNQRKPLWATRLWRQTVQLGKGRPLARDVAMGNALPAGWALVLA